MTRLVFLAWLIGWAWSAGAARASFADGNALYAAGKYTEAADAYRAEVSRGAYSANLFYNLANADFRRGERGRAILNYRRALWLEPTHEEAAANLAFLRGAAEAPPARTSAATWAWSAAAAAWLGIVAFGLGLAARSRRTLAWGTAALALIAAGSCVAALRYWTEDGASTAVVLEDKTRAYYAPADSSAAVMDLPAGGEVRVLADRGSWLYAKLPNGSRGWMSSAKVELLVPRRG